MSIINFAWLQLCVILDHISFCVEPGPFFLDLHFWYDNLMNNTNIPDFKSVKYVEVGQTWFTTQGDENNVVNHFFPNLE